MKRVLDRIAAHAKDQPWRPALRDALVDLDYAALQRSLDRAADQIHSERVGLLLSNGCPWAVLDLAILKRAGTCVPIPTFFSDDQIHHVISHAGLESLVTDQPERVQSILRRPPTRATAMLGRTLSWFDDLRPPSRVGSTAAAKLTYTSGTTGQPKAVRLSAAAMEHVVVGLSEALHGSPSDRTLSLLPLSTLLENIGGLYVPLFCGAEACVPDLTACGLRGSSGVEPSALADALQRVQPTSLIAVPQLLQALTGLAQANAFSTDGLRFVAVGGARCAPTLIERARRAGLPVYEGYGLSEACSVVSLNLPGADRPGSVGKPLPHTRIRISEQGEVLVSGVLFDGYLQHADAPGEWATGDLGYLDPDGYLFITGRRRSTYATAFGRNVSPEWVESELLASGIIAQAAVFGEARPFNAAVLFALPHVSDTAIDRAVQETNSRLPDYACIGRWTRAAEPFTAANDLASAAGAVHREAVAHRYRDALYALYEQEDQHATL